VPGGGIAGVAEGDPRLGLTIGILVLVAIAVFTVYLVGRPQARGGWGRHAADGPSAPEERAIVLPRLRLRAPSFRSWTRRTQAPTTATAAYLAVLDALAHDPILARRSSESPRAHGRRLRALQVFRPKASRPGAVGGVGMGEGTVAPATEPRPATGAAIGGSPPAGAASATKPRSDSGDLDVDLALLVADWELARYAARTLTPAEDRRGVARWLRLTEALRARRRA